MWDYLWNSTDDFNQFSANNCTISNHMVHSMVTSITFDFTNDTLGDNPANWTVYEESGTTIEVVNSSYEHEKTVRISDNSTTAYCDMYNDFAPQLNGAVEFWLYTVDANDLLRLELREGAQYTIWLKIHHDKLYYYDTGWSEICNISDATWYHFRITFECGSGGYDGLSADTFNVYLNGIKYNDIPFYQPRDNISRLTFHTYENGRYFFQKNCYLDAIDYSWSPSYFPNRSLTYYGKSIYANMSLWVAKILDLTSTTPYYGSLTLSYATNANTSVNLSYRMSADSSTWWHYNGSAWASNWSAWTSLNCSLQIYGMRYFQIRVRLTTTNPLQTPTVYSLNAKIYLF